MCIVFILTIDIGNDSIPLPAAQQTPKQIPFMVYQRPIQGTYPAKVVSNCWDSPVLTVSFHSNYSTLVQTTKNERYRCALISFNTANRYKVWNHTHTKEDPSIVPSFQSHLECFLIIHSPLYFAAMEMKWGKEFVLIYQCFIHVPRMRTFVFCKLEIDDGILEEIPLSPAFSNEIFHKLASRWKSKKKLDKKNAPKSTTSRLLPFWNSNSGIGPVNLL